MNLCELLCILFRYTNMHVHFVYTYSFTSKKIRQLFGNKRRMNFSSFINTDDIIISLKKNPILTTGLCSVQIS